MSSKFKLGDFVKLCSKTSYCEKKRGILNNICKDRVEIEEILALDLHEKEDLFRKVGRVIKIMKGSVFYYTIDFGNNRIYEMCELYLENVFTKMRFNVIRTKI